MSDVDAGRTVQPTSPATVAPASNDPAVDAYRRAVESKPTGFTEDPIGSMASAMDKLHRAASGLLGARGDAVAAGRDGLGALEAEFMQAAKIAKAQPGSLQAKQQHLLAALKLLQGMGHLKADDPRRVQLSAFIVKVAGELGVQHLPLSAPPLDVRGLLRLAAGITSRFGDATAMQGAFGLEQMLQSTISGSSPEALALRDQLMQRLGLSKQAMALIARGWTVKLAPQGTMPTIDVSARTLSLNAQQENPSLGVLARAFWQESSLLNPADKDGFVQAFLKIANSGGAFSALSRKHKEFKQLAKYELTHNRAFTSVGAVSGRGEQTDESGEMFAALATFARDGGAVPDELQAPLRRFYAVT